jgi:uncharacterized protein YehS (DUF1456 family)
MELFPLVCRSNGGNKNRKMRRISDEAIVKMKGNYQVLARLMILFNCHQKTIETWLNKRDLRLSLPEAVEIIRQHAHLKEEEILAN